MKKMFLGALLWLFGFLGINMLFILSIKNPWSYNDIHGFFGFLLGSGTLWYFIFFCLMTVLGFGICIHETYLRDYETKDPDNQLPKS
ncbi:hypothetical protein HYG86_02225 [Alkalicella caledoniensis]|uniref:Uncharacterized protein n=1 Tax=Alkalicella caledoniensis TaxID=2731377 RepID=A0A7G9W4Q3_ALKCA|nr:hypothetical protein [Alkalicella caledoniensis]QNO13665.1 hypothetical protein HYG86_02225 [Alkalicella caledoniensis]